MQGDLGGAGRRTPDGGIGGDWWRDLRRIVELSCTTMKAYHWSVRLKLGLIVFAVVIAVASLLYTQHLVDRLREREQAVIQLWAGATAELVRSERGARNPYQGELQALEEYLRSGEGNPSGTRPGPAERARFREAVNWAQTMPPGDELDFILNEILEPNPFGIPAIITDSVRQRPLFWRNVGVPDTALSTLSSSDSADIAERLSDRRAEMEASFDPIPIRISLSENTDRQITQYVYYDESGLVTELRIYPWVQLLFVTLFVVVGYLGFSYVRRSERSSLWMGMAREAAHQLGTPLSSLMGWIQMLRSDDVDAEQREQALDAIENDVERLQRVADRFSDIGSQPKLDRQNVVPIAKETAAYLRRRTPRRAQDITLAVDLPDTLVAPVNEELFAWVLENLLKNALDAIDGESGRIRVTGGRKNDTVYVEVTDTGAGIERREWTNVFRPGYSTKQRGWGLGLSLARRVVETYHGGTLELVDSTVGHGSTFRINLPTKDPTG